jgi:Zn-dependent protease with chaperone function
MLPAWVGWINLLYVPLAFVVSLVLQGTLAAITAAVYARARDLHWTARARRVYPLLALARRLSTMLCVLFGIGALLSVGPASHVGRGVLIPAVVAAILAGSFWPSWRLARRLRAASPPDAATWLRTYAFGVLLRSPYYLALGLACVFPSKLDTSVVIGLVGAAAFVVFISMGGFVRLGRCLGVLVAPPERLATVAASAAATAGVPLRAAWLARVGFANALALPLSRQIVVNAPALALFDDPELAAVCTHELGHLAEGSWASLSRMATVFAVISLSALPPLWGSFGARAALLLIVLVIMILCAWPFVSRKLEHRSDETAHRHQALPGTYARALEKLYEHELMPAEAPGRGSHGHLYDRLKAAGVVPDYPRPAPPPRWLQGGAFALMYLLIGPTAAAIGVAVTLMSHSQSPMLLQLSIGLFGRSGAPFDALAELHLQDHGDVSGAIDLERRAIAVSPASNEYAMKLAYYLALGGQCDESRTVMTGALSRAGEARRKWRVSYLVESYGRAWSARCEGTAASSAPVRSSRRP